MIKLQEINLPKWPGCDVDGDPVTRAQANEILVRTGPSYLSTNDQPFKEALDRVLYTSIEKEKEWGEDWWVDPPYDPNKPDTNFSERYDRRSKYREEMGILNLEYLSNHRACSCYIGGPHGWCDWGGRIHQRQMNVGKWPDAQFLYGEWCKIAKAFPYLSLVCRILGHEAGYHEDEPEIAVVFVVRNGEVTARPPQVDDYGHVSGKMDDDEWTSVYSARFSNPYAERGVGLDRWREACHQVAQSLAK